MKTMLLEAAESLAELPEGQKLLIITGDFHNFNQDDYHNALVFLEELFQKMRVVKNKDVFLIPGNHDVGNEKVLKELFPPDTYWEYAHQTELGNIKAGIKKGAEERKSIEVRLKAFLPYCQFVRRLGIYDGAENDTFPAQVHVRCWRGKLNILHLNTALAADGEEKENQRLDTTVATGDEIWKDFNPDLPTLALGHNSFYDLYDNVRHALLVPFLRRKVRAYLCGDTHRTERDVEQKWITIQDDNPPLTIPNVVCAKGVSEKNDTYSEYGFYLHEWDTETGKVSLKFRRWRPENPTMFSTEQWGTGTYDYSMGEIGGPHPGVSAPSEAEGTFASAGEDGLFTPADHASLPAETPSKLRAYLDRLLCDTRDAHPSFQLMRPDELDRRLFPGVEQVRAFEAMGTRAEDTAPAPVWGLIAESWKNGENRSIVIEGGGGIGKTVTLLSPPEELPAPALYLHLYELTEGGVVQSLSDYLKKRLPEWAVEILRLAGLPWDRARGPALLLLLDGFNEIPAEKRREVLRSLNKWRTDHPGTQFITVSRPLDGLDFERELEGNPIGITLSPLKREEVRSYLNDRKLPLPPENSPVWEILGYPLFLTLYAKAGKLTVTEAEGYPLDFREARSKGAIIWNYLQRGLLRRKGERNGERWVLHCALACEYILPRIASEMRQRGGSGQAD